MDTGEDGRKHTDQLSPEDLWNSLRGVLKEFYAEYGGGEAYLRNERDNFYGTGKSK